jgi:hypothetical protein
MTKSKGILKPLPSPSCYELVVSRCFLLNCHKVSQGLEQLSILVTHRCRNVQDICETSEVLLLFYSKTASNIFKPLGGEGCLLLRFLFPPRRCAKMKSTPLALLSFILKYFKPSVRHIYFKNIQNMSAICQPISSDFSPWGQRRSENFCRVLIH